MDEPMGWLADGAGQAVLVPVSVQLALLVYRAPLASPETGLAALLVAAVALMCLLMPRLDWVAGVAGSPWFGERVQFVFEVAVTCLVLLLGLCLAGFMSGFPLGLLLVGFAVLIGQVVAYRQEEEDFSPSAPEGLAARMVVPEVRALAGRGKKSR